MNDVWIRARVLVGLMRNVRLRIMLHCVIVNWVIQVILSVAVHLFNVSLHNGSPCVDNLLRLILYCHVSLFYFTEIPPEKPNPCHPSPCGANALCKERNGVGSCSCLPEYFGDPYTGCRPECVSNSDCDRSKACSNNKCKDPCPGACGINAECRTVNHSPTCTCLTGYTGNPLLRCEIEGRENKSSFSD